MRAFSRCDPADIARVAAVSLLFHASLAVEGIRLWAQERGFELPAQPEGEGCAVRWLCYVALLRECNPPVRAAAGQRHSVFIDGEGRLSSCGNEAVEGEEDEENDEDDEEEFPGLLGHGEGVTRLNTPTRLPSPLGGERAVSVSAGDAHSFAITGDGAVWSWGWGRFGKLGHGDEQHQWQPKKIEAFASQRVVAVTAGSNAPSPCRLEATTASPSPPTAASGAGHGDTQHRLLPKKIETLTDKRVVAVSAGMWHSLALSAEGTVWSCGSGGFGKLGHGDLQSQPRPKKIEALRLTSASSLCRLEPATASPSPPMAPSLPGARARTAAWATERTCRTSCCPRRSRRGRGVEVAGLRSRYGLLKAFSRHTVRPWV